MGDNAGNSKGNEGDDSINLTFTGTSSENICFRTYISDVKLVCNGVEIPLYIETDSWKKRYIQKSWNLSLDGTDVATYTNSGDKMVLKFINTKAAHECVNKAFAEYGIFSAKPEFVCKLYIGIYKRSDYSQVIYSSSRKFITQGTDEELYRWFGRLQNVNGKEVYYVQPLISQKDSNLKPYYITKDQYDNIKLHYENQVSEEEIVIPGDYTLPETKPILTPTPGITNTPKPTLTPAPGLTTAPKPTVTQKPTSTPKPTATPEPEQQLSYRIKYVPGICSHCGMDMSSYNASVEIETNNKYNPQFAYLTGRFSAPGHKQTGWNTEIDGTGVSYPINYKYIMEDNVTLYGEWSPASYRLYFATDDTIYNDGSLSSIPESIPVFAGECYGELPIMSVNGYTFLGWKTSFYGNMLINANTVHPKYEDDTAVAVWKAKTYTLKVDYNFPERLINETVAYEISYGADIFEASSIQSIPYCNGYSFAGWTIDDFYVDGDTKYIWQENKTIKGNWKAIEYTYSFDLQGGTFNLSNNAPANICFKYGDYYSKIPTVELKREGYAFGGWFTGIKGTGKKIENGMMNDISQNVTLYAYWKPNSYEVSFNYCENWKYSAEDLTGAEKKNKNCYYDLPIGELPEPSRKGYIFLGWSRGFYIDTQYNAINGTEKDIVYASDIYKTTGDMCLYAIWEPMEVYIIFDFNYDYTERIPIEEEY